MGMLGNFGQQDPSSGMAGKGGGGFFGGLVQGLKPPAQIPVWAETLNQNYGRENPAMQGPVAPIGGVSLRNRLMGSLRGAFSGGSE